jgi:2-haloacid dehalogenase
VHPRRAHRPPLDGDGIVVGHVGHGNRACRSTADSAGPSKRRPARIERCYPRAIIACPAEEARLLSAIDFSRFDALTFDTYGTLIDWERGILNALQVVLSRDDVDRTEDGLLELYAKHEAAVEAGVYRTYREVLAASVRGLCADLGVDPSDRAVADFSAAVGEWPAFPDSAAALRRLNARFRLGVLTNCDDDLFAASNRRLGVTFDWIVTAEQAGGYKPRPANFELLLERLVLPPARILHVAQSLFHDHVPARALGLATVWIDRRRDRPGFGATPPAEAAPDATFIDMASFARAATG